MFEGAADHVLRCADVLVGERRKPRANWARKLHQMAMFLSKKLSNSGFLLKGCGVQTRFQENPLQKRTTPADHR